jgi:hypothetical protein
MIDQPSGALEYDAVGAIDDKFREAVSYNMYEIIVLRPVQYVAPTTRSQARIRARHTQTYQQFSLADLMPKNLNAARFPSPLTLRPESTQRSNAWMSEEAYREAEDTPLAQATC